MVFDDDTNVLSKIYIELLLQNYEVEVTNDPKEIVPRARRQKPSLAIINHDVEGFNGVEICTLVREELRIPIILLIEPTSSSTIFIDGCKADAVLSKPLDYRRLSSVITDLMAIGS